MTYATDIDGDGKADNQLAKITGVIGSQVDLATPITMAVKSGDLLLGVRVTAADLTDACAGVTINTLNKPAAAPRFDGSDTLTINPNQTPTSLFGGIGPSAGTDITIGRLFTVAPPKQSSADIQRLSLNIPLADGVFPLVLQAVHAEGVINDRGVMSGQLHGVMSKDDVNTKIIPATAALLTQTINKDPNSSSSKTIIMLFEDQTLPASKAKCMVARDCWATNPQTCKITADEVKAQPLIGNFLAPDVQVFDANGNWAPVPKGTDKNGLSVGLGFTAVSASF